MPVSPEVKTAPRQGVQREAPLRQRLLKGDEDRFAVDQSKIPAGTSYQWVPKTIFGEEQEEQLVVMQMQGWEPVPSERHPEYFLKGQAPKGASIIRGGQILMERPVELTQEARDEDTARAKGQLQAKLDALGDTPQGGLPKLTPAQMGRSAYVQTDVERVEIVDE